ncbi:conserved Plasmodium protein, unknown function [Plasmodium relictum]|uniref:Uncharacterized protein n=1 Tax=Plasmodium relictum TaxID=85471 RepID=A0A1J1H859_PLARL|nr:conserved Plasmodium protein, unknown function [Plasmodium relictum]CRH01074.1 conserved Plasmodium protein, unknown function [Plasmodium relictum]
MDINNSDINKENNEVLWESLYNDFNEITSTHKKHFNYIENSLYEFCKGVSSNDNLSYDLKSIKNKSYLNNDTNYEEKQFLNEFLIKKEINKTDINNELLIDKNLNVENDKDYNIMINNETDYLKKEYLKNNYWENDYLKNNYFEIDYLKNDNCRNKSFNEVINSNQIENAGNFNHSSFLLNSISKKPESSFEFNEKNKYSDIRNPNMFNMNKYNSTYFNNGYKNSINNLKVHEEFLNKNDNNFLLNNNKNYDNLKEKESIRNLLGINTFDKNTPNTKNLDTDKYKNFKIKSEENLSFNNYNYIKNIKNFNSLEKLDTLLKNKCKYMNEDEIDLRLPNKINSNNTKQPIFNYDSYKINSVISENFNKNKQIDKNDVSSDKIEETNHNILINRSKRLIEISKKCLSGYSDLDNLNIIDLYKKENDYSKNGNYRDYKNDLKYHTYVDNQICTLEVNEYNNENEDNDEYEYTYENEDDENENEFKEYDESKDYNKNENNDYNRENNVGNKKKGYIEKETMIYMDNNKIEYNEENEERNIKLYERYDKKSIIEENSINSNVSLNCVEKCDTKKKEKNEDSENQTYNNSSDYDLNILFDNFDNLKNRNISIKKDQKLMNDNPEEKKKVKEKNDEGNNIIHNELEKNKEEVKIEIKKLVNLKSQEKDSENACFKDICERNVKNLDFNRKNDILLDGNFTDVGTNNIKREKNNFELENERIYNDYNLKNKKIEKTCEKEKKNGNTKLRKIIFPDDDKNIDENKKKCIDLEEIKKITDHNKILDHGTKNIKYSNNIKRLFKEKYFLEDLCEKRKCLLQKSKIENTKLSVEIKSLLSFNNNLSYALKEKEAEIKILKKQKEELEMKLMKRADNDYSFLDNSSTYDIYKNQKINSNYNICNKNSNSLNNMNNSNASIIKNYEKQIQELLVKVKMYETKNNDLQEQLKIFMNE